MCFIRWWWLRWRRVCYTFVIVRPTFKMKIIRTNACFLLEFTTHRVLSHFIALYWCICRMFTAKYLLLLFYNGRSAISEWTRSMRKTRRRTNERHYELLVLENNFHELLTARKKRKTTMWAINLWRPFRHDNISLWGMRCTLMWVA